MKKKIAIATLAVVFMTVGVGVIFARKKEKKTVEERPAKERFTATLVPAPKYADPVATIVVMDYTTDEDMKEYSVAYLNGGDGALQQALHKGMGYFNMGGNLAFGFVLARSITNGSSRTEFLIGIPPPSYLVNEWRLYIPINMQLDGKGNGSGVFYEAVKLQFDAQGNLHVIPRQEFPHKLINIHPMKN